MSARHSQSEPGSTLSTAGLALALLLLNASLTFQNRWPTPAVRWQPALSVELAAVVLAFAWSATVGRKPSRRVLAWLSGLWVLLVIGRYEYVTAPALFGRELNLYFDVKFLPDVTAMLARVAPWWAIVAVVAGLVATLAALYSLARWGLGRIAAAVETRRLRRTLLWVSVALVVVFAAQQMSAGVPKKPPFTVAVTETYARQIVAVVDGLSRTRKLPQSPSISANLGRVKGLDVLLVFVESYGAVSFERPDLKQGIDPARRQFARVVADTHRDVASALVESTTFGGNSWLAHISVISGIEVRDLATSDLLMMQKRDTLVTAFKRQGYRAIALMPGLRDVWPEGQFYGFDEMYGADRLDYHGPPFGWFTIPDQYALAKFDALEADRSPRAPLFVFMPTLSTHTPFEPIPPYQPDWSKMTTAQPYDPAVAARATSREPNWLNLGASYIDATAYEFQTFGGYLGEHADRDFVMILVGDHQPPAVVSGEGAPWDVPVHIVTSHEDILDRLVARGFRRGMDVARPSLSTMNALLPILLDAFSDADAENPVH